MRRVLAKIKKYAPVFTRRTGHRWVCGRVDKVILGERDEYVKQKYAQHQEYSEDPR